MAKKNQKTIGERRVRVATIQMAMKVGDKKGNLKKISVTNCSMSWDR